MDKLSTPDLITLLAVIVLGATGVYLLLPHGLGRAKPRVAHLVGYGLSTLAVLAFAAFWKTNVDLLHFWRYPIGDDLSAGFFYAFGLGAIGCSIMTITSRDPVHSALWFAAVVLATSGLFLLSGAQFLAAGTVIVYAGAIIVTFLFVIMLAQKEGRAIYDRMARAPFLATLASFLLLFGLVYSLLGLREPAPSRDHIAFTPGGRLIRAVDRLKPVDPPTPHSTLFRRALPKTSELPESARTGPQVSHVAALGANLFTEHLVTVELAGALLFAALIGALAIAAPKPHVRPSTTTRGPIA